MTFKILSLDGGGIRGLYSAVILEQLEKDLKKPISSCFDLVAGTSTGGILTAMMLCPTELNQPKYSASDAVALYRNRGDDIFSKTFKQIMTSMNGLIDERYSSEPFRKLLSEYAGNLNLSNLLKPCVITSYDTYRRVPHIFKQHEALFHSGKDFSIVDVCLSTSAAPTYFEPVNATNLNGEQFSLIDGGLYANNPVMCAYIESLKLKGASEDVVIVSIGTGSNNEKYSHEQIKDYGIVEWISPLLEILLDGTSQTPEYHIRKIFEDNGQSQNYFRINSDLPDSLTKMDNVSSENLQSLYDLAKKEIQVRKQSGDWDRMLEKLKSY